MARPRVDLVATAGFLAARERVWAAVRKLRAAGKPFAAADVVFLVNGGQRDELSARTGKTVPALSDEAIRRALTGFITAGFVKPVDGARRQKNAFGQHTHVCLALVRDIGVDAPRVNEDGRAVIAGLGKEQIWRTLRLKRERTATEISAAASTAKVPVARVTVIDYLRVLRRAGYVVAQGKRGHERFRLVRDTGPRPPVVQSDGALFDVNLGEVAWRP